MKERMRKIHFKEFSTTGKLSICRKAACDWVNSEGFEVVNIAESIDWGNVFYLAVYFTIPNEG